MTGVPGPGLVLKGPNPNPVKGSSAWVQLHSGETRWKNSSCSNTDDTVRRRLEDRKRQPPTNSRDVRMDTWAGSCQITRLLQSKGFIIWPDSFGWCRPAGCRIRWYTTFNFRKRSRRSVPVCQGQSHLQQEVTAVVNLDPPLLHTSSTCRRSSHREMWAFEADERRCTRVQTMTQTQKNQLPFVAMVTV